MADASKSDCTDPEPQVHLMQHKHCFIDAVLLNALQSSLTVQLLDNFALRVKAFEILLALGHM